MLVVVTASDNLSQSVDGLGEHVGGNPAGQQDGGKQRQHSTGADSLQRKKSVKFAFIECRLSGLRH